MAVIRLFGKEILSYEKRQNYQSVQITELLNNIKGIGTSLPVNETNAQKLTAVWRSVNLISETISTLEFNIYRREERNRYIDKRHPVHKLIHSRPNPLMKSMQWRESMTRKALYRGVAYSRIYRDNKARPVELRYIPDVENVVPVVYDNQLFYHFARSRETIPASDMFVILWTSLDGITPISPIKAASIAISRGLSASFYGDQVFKYGGTKKIAIKTLGSLDEPQKKNIRNSWMDIHGGIENAHKPLILEGGMEVKEIGISPSDAQLLESEQFTVEEVARLYGVPLHMLQSPKSGGYNSNEQQNIEFNTYTMNPWYTRWETEAMDKLLYESELESHYINIDNAGLLRGDSKARIEYLRGRFQVGSISPNEIREREGEDPSNNEALDKHYLQKQYVPIEDAGKIDGNDQIIEN